MIDRTPTEIGPVEHLTTINGPDGKIVFYITIYPKIKTVCISSKEYDLVYELDWDAWVKVSDLLIQRMQAHK